jgi:hypothetical protein
VAALIGLGANLPADAVYPSPFFDSKGKAPSGANRSALPVNKGQEPPVHALWSVTICNTASFFVANQLNRYAVSSWKPFKHNADGSLEIYIQKDSPGSLKEANWLRAPKGQCNLTLRMYWPTEEPPTIVDGSWKPPAVRAIS